MIRRLHFLFLLLAAAPLAAEIAAQRVTTERDGTNLKVLIDGKLFTEFRGDGRQPCLHPLMSPGGTHLTRQFPFVKDIPGEEADHPHHTGFWFTHGDVNGLDFWHGRKGEKIVTKGVSLAPQIVDEKSAAPSSTGFKAELSWQDGEDREVLAEVRTYHIEVRGKTRTIDVTCELTATNGDVTFGDTKEGSFAIRVAPTLRLKGKVAKGGILTSEGLKDGAAWGKRAAWVAYHGPDSAGTPQVITLMDHPSNLRHPTWWHARDYGLLTANPFGPRGFKDKEWKGTGDHTLKTGATLTQRYRLVLHEGTLASAGLDGLWEAFRP